MLKIKQHEKQNPILSLSLELFLAGWEKRKNDCGKSEYNLPCHFGASFVKTDKGQPSSTKPSSPQVKKTHTHTQLSR